MIFGACTRPEYPMKFISTDKHEFDAYKEKCSSRPSPPERSSANFGETNVFITYSQPAVKNRTIWNGLVKFNQLWRTGANEATVFSTSGDVLINGDTLRAGNYAMYTIPTKNKWTLIFNNKYDVWGAYDYDQSLDALRISIDPTFSEEHVERLTFVIDETGTVKFNWEKLTFDFVVLPI